jgi:hypothetical protein
VEGPLDAIVQQLNGYTDDVLDDPAILQTDTNFLEKPFLPSKLIFKARHILGARSDEPPAAEYAPPEQQESQMASRST